jgi:hypothetical protein
MDDFGMNHEVVDLSYEFLSNRGVPLLWVGGTLMRRCAHLLRGGTPLLSHLVYTCHILGWIERWNPICLHFSHFTSEVVRPPSQSGSPSSLELSNPLVI